MKKSLFIIFLITVLIIFKYLFYNQVCYVKTYDDQIFLVRNLVDIYNFKIHWETGHTKEIPDIDLDTKLYSCIYIPKKLIEESLGNGLVGAGKYLYF